MTMETVLTNLTDLKSEVLPVIADACEDAGVFAEFLSSDEIIRNSDSLTPSLLIASLPEGQRSVPQQVTKIATEVFPGLPVILLCEESISRGLSSMADGSLTLVGSPWSTAKIGSRIRATISRLPLFQPEETVLPQAKDGDDPFLAREYRGAGFWLGTIVPLNPTSYVLRFQISDEGLTGICSEHSGGDIAAGVDLSTRASQWSFACPQHVSGFWLISERRIPAILDLTKELDAESGSQLIQAEPGDLVAIVYGDEIPDALSPEHPEFAEAMQDGGPSLLDYIAITCESQHLELSALVAECL